MAFAGGWICRVCWKSNRPGDDRCYRCHTPRNADDATVQQQRAAGGKAGPRDTAAGVLDLLLALPPVVFAWYGRLLQVGGILFLGLTVLVLINPQAPVLAWLV